MRPKSLLLLALALGSGLVASIGISQVMDKNRRDQLGAETAPIYVALHNVNLGDPIDAAMVSLQEWPKDRIPAGAIISLENLEGRRPRTNIFAGEPILEAKLLAQGELVDPIGGIPPGFRLATIGVDAETSAAGLLSPGDRVDVQLYVDANERANIPRSMSKVILQNIRVFAIEQAVQRAADGGEARTVPKTVSLLVTPEQASKIDLAQKIGAISLIPRSPNDEAPVAASEVNLDDLLGNADAKNSRAKEQTRQVAAVKPKGPGMLSGLMQMVASAAKARPPHRMTIVRADEVSEMLFDATTGRPLTPDDNKIQPSSAPQKGTSQAPTPAAPPSALPVDAPTIDAAFPIDFNAP